MQCELKKTIGRKWNMKYEYSADIITECTLPAKYIIKAVMRNGKIQTIYTCGVHKNSIISHSKKVGNKLTIKAIA